MALALEEEGGAVTERYDGRGIRWGVRKDRRATTIPLIMLRCVMFERLTRAQLSHHVLIAVVSSGAGPPQVFDEWIFLPRNLLQSEALNAFVEDLRDRGEGSDVRKAEERDHDTEQVFVEQVESSEGAIDRGRSTSEATGYSTAHLRARRRRDCRAQKEVG